MPDVRLIDQAVEDLRRLAPSVVPRVLTKMLLLERDAQAGHPLGGALTGYRKLVAGNRTWRIVYRVLEDGTVEVCEVWAVGARADQEVYAEASERVARLAQGPRTAGLASVIERLGRLAQGVRAQPPTPGAAPLPGWLVDRLVHTAALDRAAVERMTPDEALEAWTDYQLRSR